MDNNKKLTVEDANKLDKRIPRDLIIMYQNKPYITKAGLCWKMNYLFGGNNWGVTNEIIEKTPEYVLVKATLKTRDGMEFSNYGEASKANVTNSMMHKYLLHLAVTRAENRVIRTATACGYTSIEEMDMGGQKEIPVSEDDGLAATDIQLQALKVRNIKHEKAITRGEARKLIVESIDQKKGAVHETVKA